MKRLWRVTWVDRFGDAGTRHYQSMNAAMHRVDVLCEGRRLSAPIDGYSIPPVAYVRVDRSDPVTFPADYADEVAALMWSLQPVTGE